MAESKNLSSDEVGEEDRLSSLPEAILIDILSRIPTNLAASTSLLSHRWRNLWTAVTRFNLYTDASDFTAIVEHILGQLTSPKLTDFKLSFLKTSNFPEHDVVESCFRHVCDRFVEKVLIDELYSFNVEGFPVPVSLLHSQFLVVLEMGGELMFDFELPGNGDVIHLPNLKKLKLVYILGVPLWLGTLIRCCPLLENLDLRFKLDNSEIADCLDILGLNLKSLKIELDSSSSTPRIKVSIDAPKLANLEIKDWYSYYHFVHNPTTLVNACIDLRRDERFLEVFVYEEDERDFLEDDDFLHLMSKFVRGMSCAINLDLKLESHTNVLSLLGCVDDECLPTFCSLNRYEVSLRGFGLSGWKDLLPSLRYFPNIKHLKVNMEGEPPPKYENWCPPNYIPDCFVSNLKTIQILGLDGLDDDLKLLRYILCNACHLEELLLHESYVYINEYEKAYALWNERQFCKSLFKLPRISSTCEIVFSGRFFTASSNTFKNGYLTCQMYMDD